jgi:branched-chain amino acid transport system permease protein
MLRTRRQRITLIDIIVWGIGGAIGLVVIIGTIATLRSGKYTPATWVDLTIKGLAQGGVYALIAMGYTMVYGILRMINFAHSEVFMSGPFTAVFLANALAQTGFMDRYPVLYLILILILSMAVSTTIAVMLERIAYRPIRYAPRLVPLITAIGASFFLQYTFRGLYGSGFKAYPIPLVLQGSITLGSVRIYNTQIVAILGALAMMVVLYTFVQKTRVGKAMRAVSEDKEVAALMGINVDRIIAMTFTLGGASAGAAGILYTLLFPVVNFYMGFIPGLKAFTAAVLGGIGNVAGAFLGGSLLGLIESVGPNLFFDGLGIPTPSQLKDGIAFTILVLILIFRPTGILGEQVTQTKA